MARNQSQFSKDGKFDIETAFKSFLNKMEADGRLSGSKRSYHELKTAFVGGVASLFLHAGTSTNNEKDFDADMENLKNQLIKHELRETRGDN